MKNRIPKILMSVLLIFLLVLVFLLLWGIKLPSQETMSANVQIVEAPQQETAMENENFVKEEYVSILPEGENIARQGKIGCNGFNETYTAQKSIDGRTTGASYWEGESDAYPNELTLTYKEGPVTVHAIRVCVCPDTLWGKRTQTFSVLYTTDGETRQELIPEASYEFNPDSGNEVILTFDQVELQSIILSFTGNTGAKGAQVAEWEVYSTEQ